METYEMWIVWGLFVFSWWVAGKETGRLMGAINKLEDQIKDLKREVERCRTDIDRIEDSRF